MQTIKLFIDKRYKNDCLCADIVKMSLGRIQNDEDHDDDVS